MLDIFNIPEQQDNVKIFYANGVTAWQTWQKPRGAKFIWMMCMGGGAGGNGAGSGSVLSSPQIFAGGSGAITRALFTANALPDTLYIQPGLGGAGGAGTQGTLQVGGSGVAGNKSFVSIEPSSATVLNLVCTSGTTAAAAGSGETALTNTALSAGLLSLGTFTSVAGAGPSGANITPFSSTILTGGGGHGGGGTSIEGASILATNLITFSSPLISAGGVNTGARGRDGIWSWKPMYGLGGACGGSNNAGVGGNGGNGAYGCGGGSGAPGTFAAGGNGGRGGDGLVIIATF